MKLLRKVKVSMKHCVGDVSVVEWCSSDPFPSLGPVVGMDTETEPITETVLDPPVVVLGCFDPSSMTCYVVYWMDIPAFMRQLNRMDIQQRYFNLGYDEAVTDNEDEDKTLLDAINAGRVRDMQIRVHLHEVATTGFIRKALFNLAGCALQFLNVTLDKGDGTEQSARLSFRRFNPDGTLKKMTEEQEAYLPFDCISTWALGEEVPEAPVDPHTGMSIEIVHTQGMVALYHISINGLNVDRRIFDALETKLLSDRDSYREELIGFGFPDPYKKDKDEAREVRLAFYNACTEFYGRVGMTPAFELDEDGDVNLPAKTSLRLAVCYMYNNSEAADEVQQCIANVAASLESDRKSLRKAEQTLYLQLCDEYGLAAVDSAKRAIAMEAFVCRMLENYVEQFDSGSAAKRGFDFAAAVEAAGEYVDEHPDWLAPVEKVGPKKFFQTHVKKMLDDYTAWREAKPPMERDATPKLVLKTTDKSKEIKLTLKDMWRLEDCGISDPFLTSYTNFNHCTKLLSTYLNRKYVKADDRVHPRFTSVKRTGRTSCASPNIQNLPSRDKVYPVKNIYCPPEGAILCATDFSFIELVALAESCIQRFGHSVLGDVINAQVDPHRWFAGVRKKLITNETSFLKDPEKAAELEAFLEQNVTKKERQDAKPAKRNWPFSRRRLSKKKVNCWEAPRSNQQRSLRMDRTPVAGTFGGHPARE